MGLFKNKNKFILSDQELKSLVVVLSEADPCKLSDDEKKIVFRFRNACSKLK